MRWTLKKYWKNPEYAEFITRHPCVDCGGYTGYDRFHTLRVDASHIKTKGSGGGEYNNLIPQCRSCHIKFESKSRSAKQEYKKLAESFTKQFIEANLDCIDLDTFPIEN